MTTRRSYKSLAKRLYPNALWISGRGQYASLAYCGGLTVELYDTPEEAQAAKSRIDDGGCGHACQRGTRNNVHIIGNLGGPWETPSSAG